MNVTLDGLLACLELTEVEPGVLTGPNLEIDYHRIFGGQILAQAPRDEDALVVADLNLDIIREVRNTWQFFRDRRPETYESLAQR